MSGLGWQDLAAVLAAASAVAYLVRRRLRARAKSACGGCEGCATAEAPRPGSELVRLESPLPPGRGGASPRS